MVDTIRAGFFGEWRPSAHDGWDVRVTRRIKGDGEAAWEGVERLMVHRDSGMRVGGTEEFSLWLEVSLPRMIHGTNAMMIRDQGQLDEAIERLLAAAREVSVPLSAVMGAALSRVDLCAQFRFPPDLMILAHREAVHPCFRRRPDHYRGGSLRFVGSERVCKFYDKLHEMSRQPGDVVRVEWELRSRALARDFGREPVVLGGLRIDDCYQTFRRLCLAFEPAPPPAARPSVADMLTVGIRDGVELGGIPIFDFWARGRAPRTVRRMRLEVARRCPAVFSVDWRALLPERLQDFPMVDLDMVANET